MLYNGRSSFGWSLILLCIQWFLQPWLYFVGFGQATKESCELIVQTPVIYNIYDPGYLLTSHMGAIFATIIGVGALWVGISLILWDLKAEVEITDLSDANLGRESLDRKLLYIIRQIR
jgi:hypothetical protein